MLPKIFLFAKARALLLGGRFFLRIDVAKGLLLVSRVLLRIDAAGQSLKEARAYDKIQNGNGGKS